MGLLIGPAQREVVCSRFGVGSWAISQHYVSAVEGVM